MSFLKEKASGNVFIHQGSVLKIQVFIFLNLKPRLQRRCRRIQP